MRRSVRLGLDHLDAHAFIDPLLDIELVPVRRNRVEHRLDVVRMRPLAVDDDDVGGGSLRRGGQDDGGEGGQNQEIFHQN